VLTSGDLDAIDPACGCWYNRGLLCKVYRCDEPFPSEKLVPASPDFEDSIPPVIPTGHRDSTPIGPVREDNFGPYGKEYGTCPAPEKSE
jgi:hypothetical protein